MQDREPAPPRGKGPDQVLQPLYYHMKSISMHYICHTYPDELCAVNILPLKIPEALNNNPFGIHPLKYHFR